MRWPLVTQTFAEVRGPLGWGILCYNESLEFEVGHAVCRETKEMFTHRMRKAAVRSYPGNRYTGSIDCGSSAVSVKECELHLSVTDSCPNDELVLDCTTCR